MEKIGKIKTIARAFTTDSNIDEVILLERRKICEECPLNSNNIKESDLNLIDKIKKRTSGDNHFCVACGCFINEKTSQETEECGLGEKGDTPKWFRVKLETTDRLEIDIINDSHNKTKLDLTADSKAFEFDYGEINKDSNLTISFKIKSKIGINLDLASVTPSCGSCTESEFEKEDDNTYNVKVTLAYDQLPYDRFSKNLYLGYYIRSKYIKNVIKLIGIKK